MLLRGDISESKLTLAKEVKLFKYSDKTCPAHG